MIIELTSEERWLIQEAVEAEIDALNRLRRLGASSEYDGEKLATARRLLEKIKGEGYGCEN
jgi:hypothetical protein